MPNPNQEMSYPHRRYNPHAAPDKRAQWEGLQLDYAISHFKAQVKAYRLKCGHGFALGMEIKEEIFPHLEALVACGWEMTAAEHILWSQGHDVKSLARAEIAFKSMGDFAARAGIAQAGELHIALYYIGKALQAAAREKRYNPEQPRVPAGSSGGGQWTSGGGTLSGAQLDDELGRIAGGDSDRTARFRELVAPMDVPSADDTDHWWDEPASPSASDTDTPPAHDASSGVRDLANDITNRLEPIGAGQRELEEQMRQQLSIENVATALAAVSAPEALALTKFYARTGEFVLDSAMRPLTLANSMDAIEAFFGNRIPADRIFDEYPHTEQTDMLLRQGDFQLRFDIVKFGNFKNARPHFQIETKVLIDGEEHWVDAEEHWYDFVDSYRFRK